MNLDNSVCLITGSNVRVGKAIALTLSQKGAHICIHYNSQKSEAESTAETIRSSGKECLIVKGDISKKQDWLNMCSEMITKWGKIDV